MAGAGAGPSKEEWDEWLKQMSAKVRENQGLPAVDENVRSDESTYLGDYVKKLKEIEKLPVEELQSLQNYITTIIGDEELKKLSPTYHGTFKNEIEQIRTESEGLPNAFVHKRLLSMVIWLRTHIEDQLFTLQGGRRRRRKTRKSKKSIRRKTRR